MPSAPAPRPGISRGPGARRPRGPAGPRTGTTGLTESQTPKWQRLERKELRLRGDQLDELARLRRTLNRQRGGEGERITENTLIRVAVDLLLARAERCVARRRTNYGSLLLRDFPTSALIGRILATRLTGTAKRHADGPILTGCSPPGCLGKGRQVLARG